MKEDLINEILKDLEEEKITGIQPLWLKLVSLTKNVKVEEVEKIMKEHNQSLIIKQAIENLTNMSQEEFDKFADEAVNQWGETIAPFINSQSQEVVSRFKPLLVSVGYDGVINFLELFPDDEQHGDMREWLDVCSREFDSELPPGLYMAELDIEETQSSYYDPPERQLVISKMTPFIPQSSGIPMTPSFHDWIKGFETRYTEDQLWHMKWAFEVGVSLARK